MLYIETWTKNQRLMDFARNMSDETIIQYIKHVFSKSMIRYNALTSPFTRVIQLSEDKTIRYLCS